MPGRSRVSSLILLCLLVAPWCAASGEQASILVRSGRPLNYAAGALAEYFRTPVSVEEDAYAPEHPLSALTPQGEPKFPAVVTFSVRFAPSDGLKGGLTRMLEEAATLLPERYALQEMQSAGWAVVPTVREGKPPAPLSTPVLLPEEVNTLEALELLLKQVHEALPQVQLNLARIPDSLAAKKMLHLPRQPVPARQVLHAIAALWSEDRQKKGEFYNWDLRFGPEVSTPQQQQYALCFSMLKRTESAPNFLLVESSHYVSDAAAMLENWFRVPVLVEEPPVNCRSGLLGVPESENVALVGGLLALRWKNGDTLETVLTTLIQQTRVFDGGAGTVLFDLKREHGFALVPSKMTGTSQGDIQDYAPLLSVSLANSLLQTSGSLTESDIAALAARAAGRRVEGSSNSNETFSLASRKPLGDLQSLLSALEDSAGGKTSFHLLYDPVLRGHRLVARHIDQETMLLSSSSLH